MSLPINLNVIDQFHGIMNCIYYRAKQFLISLISELSLPFLQRLNIILSYPLSHVWEADECYLDQYKKRPTYWSKCYPAFVLKSILQFESNSVSKPHTYRSVCVIWQLIIHYCCWSPHLSFSWVISVECLQSNAKRIWVGIIKSSINLISCFRNWSLYIWNHFLIHAQVNLQVWVRHLFTHLIEKHDPGYV